MVFNDINDKISAGRKQLAVLIDPDKLRGNSLDETVRTATDSGADMLFVGSSLLTSGRLESTITSIKALSELPVVLFPGSTLQISALADAILFLSLISGRNPEMLIGKHVVAAPYIKDSGIEVISTGYMLIESGRPTAAQYMSNSNPIPADKNDIALCTAMAGEMLGLRMIYMDAGSGAQHAIQASMIRNVREGIRIPLIIGGGICSSEQAVIACEAGADILVVGNAIEKDCSLIPSIVKAIR